MRVEILNSFSKLKINEAYTPYIGQMETEAAIKFIKDRFQSNLARALNLRRVSAPLVVFSKTGLNDNLNGIERPIVFRIRAGMESTEIVQSLAKWKRDALRRYGFSHGEGLYTDMNAIRPDEIIDNTHSIYVDQWDWEKVISTGERNLSYLKRTVRKIYSVIREMEKAICERHPELPAPYLPDKITFVHSEDLEAMFPELPPRERENEICRKHKAVFIIGIGYPLSNGIPHDGRAADYDDWSTETKKGYHGLNGDILVHYPVLDQALELSSMGIRVDENSLLRQLEMKGEMHKTEFPFHKSLLSGELPLTIGGGIGQSRLCMFFLRKAHIGEVQASVWPDDVIETCRENNIILL